MRSDLAGANIASRLLARCDQISRFLTQPRIPKHGNGQWGNGMNGSFGRSPFGGDGNFGVRRHRGRRKLATLLVFLAITWIAIAALAIMTILSLRSTKMPALTTPIVTSPIAIPSSPPTTMSARAVARSAYDNLENSFATELNSSTTAQIAAIGSNNTSAFAAAINQQVADRVAFDTALRAIQFPPSDQPDVTAILAADTRMETDLRAMAVNAANLSAYNKAFASYKADSTSFTNASSALSVALG